MTSKGSRARESPAVRQVRGPFLTLPPHPLAVTTEAELLERAAKAKRPIAVDLFCGAGGLSLGLQQAGFDVLLGVDHDEVSLETHGSMFSGLTKDVDMSDRDEVEALISLLKRLNPTLIAGGPPCQPFSRAGRSKIRSLVAEGHRSARDERSFLWEAFVYVIEQVQPEAVLLENVPDMALGENMAIMREIVDRLESGTYSIATRLLDASRYGVPQQRQRFILVGLLGGKPFKWPLGSAKAVTVGDAISDLPWVKGGYRPSGGAQGSQRYRSEPRCDFQARARANDLARTDRVYDHITRPVREDDLVAFRGMTSQTKYSELDPKLKRYRDDIFDDKYKKLAANDLSRSITAHIAKDGYWYIHPTQPRTLTVREAARIQTFPDHVRFAGPPSHAFRQIGNAVPPRLAEVVGRRILLALRSPATKQLTTREISSHLAAWQRRKRVYVRPWLHERSAWLAILGGTLLFKTAQSSVNEQWPRLSRLRSPRALLNAAAKGKESVPEKILHLAEWFSKHDPSVSDAKLIPTAPGVGKALGEIACLAGGLDDPVIANASTLRVAARFFGVRVNLKNKMSDGRMAVARMVGTGVSAPAAELAMLEIAEGYCQPSTPDCCGCPLRLWCATSKKTSGPSDTEAQQLPVTD